MSRLTPADTDAVLDLYRACPDYFLLQDGKVAERADAEALFEDRPASAPASALSVIGCWQGEALVGVASLVAHHPQDGDWYLGLLLLRPSVRGGGLGRSFYTALETWARDQGAGRLLLCVFEDDDQALGLWAHLGFVPGAMLPAARFKAKSHRRQEMVRRLTARPERTKDQMHGRG